MNNVLSILNFSVNTNKIKELHVEKMLKNVIGVFKNLIWIN
jgi:hypothetical protein